MNIIIKKEVIKTHYRRYLDLMWKYYCLKTKILASFTSKKTRRLMNLHPDYNKLEKISSEISSLKVFFEKYPGEGLDSLEIMQEIIDELNSEWMGKCNYFYIKEEQEAMAKIEWIIYQVNKKICRLQSKQVKQFHVVDRNTFWKVNL